MIYSLGRLDKALVSWDSPLGGQKCQQSFMGEVYLHLGRSSPSYKSHCKLPRALLIQRAWLAVGRCFGLHLAELRSWLFIGCYRTRIHYSRWGYPCRTARRTHSFEFTSRFHAVMPLLAAAQRLENQDLTSQEFQWSPVSCSSFGYACKWF